MTDKNTIYSFDENKDQPPTQIIIVSKEPSIELEKPSEEVESKEIIEEIHTTLTLVRADHQLDFKDVNNMIKDAYSFIESNNSTVCDIIAMYLKGQKILYTEAKTLCEQRLNYLMLPAIFVTALCTILSLVLKEYSYGPTIVSSLNGFNAFILALISYLKLDAKAESHRIAAYRYDKLQSNLEFNSGKILFIKGDSDELAKIINDTEANVKEIKETNQFILPESIRYNYPATCNTNVFAEVKHIQCNEVILINQLKEIINEQQLVQEKIDKKNISHDEAIEEFARLETLRKSITEDIIKIKDQYLKIDDRFEDEVKHALSSNKNLQLCGCLKT